MSAKIQPIKTVHDIDLTICNISDSTYLTKNGTIIPHEKGFEFSAAKKAATAMQEHLKSHLSDPFDNRTLNRLTQEFIQVIQADRYSVRGKRIIKSENLGILTGFDFNLRSQLGAMLFAKYNLIKHHDTGHAELAFDPFIPIQTIAAPVGITHFKITLSAVPINSTTNLDLALVMDSDVIKWNKKIKNKLSFSFPSKIEDKSAMALIIGIVYYKKINKQLFDFENGALNTYCISHILE